MCGTTATPTGAPVPLVKGNDIVVKLENSSDKSENGDYCTNSSTGNRTSVLRTMWANGSYGTGIWHRDHCKCQWDSDYGIFVCYSEKKKVRQEERHRWSICAYVTSVINTKGVPRLWVGPAMIVMGLVIGCAEVVVVVGLGLMDVGPDEGSKLVDEEGLEEVLVGNRAGGDVGL